MPKPATVNHQKFPLALALGDSGFDREEVRDAYGRLERRAVYLLKGWEVSMGFTPDDLASRALTDYLKLRNEGREPEDAYPMASRGLQQAVYHLFQKMANNPTDYFEEAAHADPDQEEEDSSEELTALEASVIYFHPDLMDWIANLLSSRETQAVTLRYEADLDLHGVAGEMGIGYETAKTLVKRSLKKLRGVLSP